MINLRYQEQAWNDWAQVRRKALMQALRDRLARQPSALIPLQEVHARLPLRGCQYRGLQQVPLALIIGSAGRYTDFDRSFLPRQAHLEARWQRVSMAHYEGRALPPIEVYKLGEVYFVQDGHHRVSVARAHGWETIPAYVTEYVVDVPLDEHLSVRDLLLKEEYSDFLGWTQLHRLRPEQRIELSALGGYLDLIGQINRHREGLTQERGEDVSVAEAVASWYDQVYLSLVKVIRQHAILSHFPGRTEADLVLWIMQQRHALQKLCGCEPGLEAIILDYATQFGQRSIWARIGKAVQALVPKPTSLPCGCAQHS